jgi:hypothetical protein
MEAELLLKRVQRALLPQKAALAVAAQSLQLSNVITEVRLLEGRKLPEAEAL